MPWINLTVRRGAMSKPTRHALMARLTEVLMFWEKIPDTPKARKIMRGWVYEVDEDADYSGGQSGHEKPYYWTEIRIPIDRLDVLAKSGLIRDFTEAILASEGAQPLPEEARRVWVTIHELKRDDWGIGGHTDWLRDYTSALDPHPPQ
jgi:phenylpyruvate tautomerase PptA (4-oxalocrotonate tautomerase family)